MKRATRVVLILMIAAVATYWVGTDVMGLWLPVRLPWIEYAIEVEMKSVTLHDASQEQVASELFTAWLKGYESRKLDPLVRLRQHEIAEIQDFRATDEGFVCMIRYHVKPYAKLPKEALPSMTLRQLRTSWVAGNGVVQDGWMKDKIVFIWVKQDGDTYTIVDWGTCPPELLG